MYALILQSEQRVEVLGFVHYGGSLRAVYRDDEGHVWDLPAEGIRMEPNTVGAEVKEPELCLLCGKPAPRGEFHDHVLVDLPVVDGYAILPDGRKIATNAPAVSVPVSA